MNSGTTRAVEACFSCRKDHKKCELSTEYSAGCLRCNSKGIQCSFSAVQPSATHAATSTPQWSAPPASGSQVVALMATDPTLLYSQGAISYSPTAPPTSQAPYHWSSDVPLEQYAQQPYPVH
ncbi:hypothetical protein BU15DRAFT_58087 [Melanogaster broomeanus]|nr:hypothetical protein BU15DRAFT_58087 [Melanogaster broomeanus]